MSKKTSKYVGFTNEQLIEKIEKLEKERYGLVWEDKEEDVAKQCEIELPLLAEDTSRQIISDNSLPYNVIIEGDNYHSLYTLNFTHKKKIDVIYIDPPYNTGKKNEWKYNDHWIDENDSYRHSKWLSFMSKRLRLAKNLLKDTGVIFISIDDNEMAPLKLLCDKIFGEKNFVASAPRKTGAGSAATRSLSELRKCNDFVMIYGKSNKTIFKRKIVGEKEYELSDENGKYMLGQFQASGSDATRKDRPNMWYPIYITKTGNLTTIKQDDYEKIIIPNMVNGEDGRWLWNKEKFENDNEKYIFYDGDRIFRKIYYDETKDQTIYQVEKAYIDDARYNNSKGTIEINTVFDKKRIFNNPKPVELIKFLLNLHPDSSTIILDFFAGSGTTGHAVMELNKEDGGNRQFILCTNNENNICEEVTYPRIKKVIEGYADKEGIPGNVKYFRQVFVPNVLNDEDKRTLVAHSTELLCMAEGTFECIDIRSGDFQSPPNERSYSLPNKNTFAIFHNHENQTAIIYDEDSITDCVSYLNKDKNKFLQTVIYVFSYDHTYHEDDFSELNIPYIVKPIPEAILNVYRKIAKLRKK